MGVSIIPFYKRSFWVSLLPVGRTAHQEVQQSGVPAVPRITTSLELQTSGDTTPNPGSHSAATAVLDRGIEVKQRTQSYNKTEPPVSSPITVRPLFYLSHTTLTGPLRNIAYVGVSN